MTSRDTRAAAMTLSSHRFAVAGTESVQCSVVVASCTIQLLPVQMTSPPLSDARSRARTRRHVHRAARAALRRRFGGRCNALRPRCRSGASLPCAPLAPLRADAAPTQAALLCGYAAAPRSLASARYATAPLRRGFAADAGSAAAPAQEPPRAPQPWDEDGAFLVRSASCPAVYYPQSSSLSNPNPGGFALPSLRPLSRCRRL